MAIALDCKCRVVDLVREVVSLPRGSRLDCVCYYCDRDDHHGESCVYGRECMVIDAPLRMHRCRGHRPQHHIESQIVVVAVVVVVFVGDGGAAAAALDGVVAVDDAAIAGMVFVPPPPWHCPFDVCVASEAFYFADDDEVVFSCWFAHSDGVVVAAVVQYLVSAVMTARNSSSSLISLSSSSSVGGTDARAKAMPLNWIRQAML